jgi:large repetitive protein
LKNWLTFWRNRRPFDLERALRASRPKPPADLVKAIMGDVRRRPVRQLRLGRALVGASALAILLVSVSLVAGLGTGGGIKQHLSLSNADASCSQYSTAPAITNVAPSSGAVGDAVTITGSGFKNGNGDDTTVTFNGTPATIGTLADSSISTTVPGGATTGLITVANNCGSATASFTVLVTPSNVTFSPASGAVGSTVTVNADSGLTGASAVSFNGTPAASFTPVNDTTLTAVVPSGATDGPIAVTTAPGHTGTSAASFKISPRITSFTPTSGLPGTAVTISGDHFGGATAVTFGGTPASSYTVNGAGTSINAIVAGGTPSGPVAVTTPDGTGASAGNFFVLQTPSNVTFSPGSGGVGASVTITGQHFSGTSTVKFNATSASFTVNSDTQITATVPTGATTGKITVTNSVGSGVSASSFTVIAAPTVSSFTPTAGVGGVSGTSVTINGSKFTGATAVAFNGTPATTFAVVSDTKITATVPSGATTGKISVTSPGGTGSSVANFTVYVQPVVSGMTPSTNQAGGTVTLVGSGFTGANLAHTTCPSCGVTFNGIAVTFTFNSDSMLTLTVPASATGSHPFVVTTPGGTGSSGSFTVAPVTAAPTVSGISPASGPANAQHQESVTITGTNFLGATKVQFGTLAATSVSINSSTQITALAPIGALTGDVVVTNAKGASPKSAPDVFTVDPLPTIVSFSPTSGLPNALVTISGAHLTNVTSVSFGGSSDPVTPTTTSTGIQVQVPADAATGPISVTTKDGTTNHTIGTATSSGTFIVPGTPTISSFTPSAGKTGTIVTINGSGFLGGSTPHVIFFNGGTNPTALATVKSNTQLTVSVPAAVSAGVYTLKVQNDAGTSTASSGTFTVTSAPPGAFIFSPAFGPANAQKTTSVVLTGTGFTGATGVTFGGKSAVFTVNDDSHITAFVPTGATTGTIIVTNPSGSKTSTTPFTVSPLPSITSFTPAPPNGAVVGGGPVNLTGMNFKVTNPDSSTSQVDSIDFNGAHITSGFTVNSPTSITIANVPAGASTGQLKVTNSATGSATSAASFVVIQSPTIASFSPASGIAGTKVTINGSGFLGNTTKVAFTGAPSLATPTVLSDTQMTVMVPAGTTPGQGPITVSNLAGSSAPSDDIFTVAAKPTISTFSPTNGPASSDATTVVDIQGSNFNGTTDVKFGTVSSPFISVDDTGDITAVVPAGAKSGKITVINPAGQALSAGTFTVNPPPVVKAVTPNVGAAGASVTITGSNFITGMGGFVANDPSDMFVQFSGDGNASTSLTATSLTVNVPAFAVSGPVELENIWGEGALAPSLFKVVQVPVVDDAFTYFTASNAGLPGEAVEILGSGFTGTTAVSFGSHAASSFTVVGDSEILATLPKNFTTGSIGVPVHVTNAGGTGDGPDFFLVQAPHISSFGPSSGAVGDPVTITGTGLEGVFDVEFNGTSADFTVDSETQITATVPAGATSGTISVTNESGSDTSSGSFTVTP